MSADNGVYVAEFPTRDGGKEWRVAEYSDSCINDLFGHLMPPDEKKDVIDSIFGGESFDNRDDANALAFKLDAPDEDGGWSQTEYGVCQISFDFPFGDLPPEVPEPELSPGACRHCSTPGFTERWHSEKEWKDCRNPNLPYNMLLPIIRERLGSGVNAAFITSVAIEGMMDLGLLPRPGAE